MAFLSGGLILKHCCMESACLELRKKGFVVCEPSGSE